MQVRVRPASQNSHKRSSVDNCQQQDAPQLGSLVVPRLKLDNLKAAFLDVDEGDFAVLRASFLMSFQILRVPQSWAA